MGEKRVPQINRVSISGNLVHEPELRKTNSGTPVANFRIASDRRFRDSSGEQKEETCFVGIIAWARLAESCANYLQKGSAVYIEGELQSRHWEDDSGMKRSMVEVRAHRIQFLDRRDTERDEEQDQDGVNGNNGESDPQPR